LSPSVGLIGSTPCFGFLHTHRLLAVGFFLRHTVGLAHSVRVTLKTTFCHGDTPRLSQRSLAPFRALYNAAASVGLERRLSAINLWSSLSEAN